MSEEASAESDYLSRLLGIFQSCDSTSKGYLTLLEFDRLCRQLQLQHQRHRLYKGLGLSGSASGKKVYFEDFQSALLSVLQEVGPHTLSSGPYQFYSDTGQQETTSATSFNSQHQPSQTGDLGLKVPLDTAHRDKGRQQRKTSSSPQSSLDLAFLEMCAN